jgi:hypothetical protein
MMVTTTDSLESDLDRARKALDVTAAETDRLHTERQEHLDAAGADEDARTQLEQRAEFLKLRAYRNHEPAALLELDTIQQSMARLRDRAQWHREAAESLGPAINAHAPEHHRAARAVNELEFKIRQREHAKESAALQAKLATLEPDCERWINSATAIEREHRTLYGAPVNADATPAFRLQRFLLAWVHDMSSRLLPGHDLSMAMTARHDKDRARLD